MSEAACFSCPVQNVCEVSFADGPECGSVSEHLPPILAAEDLCVRALAGQLQNSEVFGAIDDAEPETIIRANEALGFAHLELALNPDTAKDVAEDHFDDAAIYFERVTADVSQPLFARFNAMLAQIYHPLFLERRLITAETAPLSLSLAQLRLATLTEAILAAPQHPRSLPCEHQYCYATDAERLSYVQTIALHMLGAREGLVIYPSGPRETTNTRGTAKTGHSAYAMIDDLKVPLQVVTADADHGEYDQEILLVHYDKMIARAAVETKARTLGSPRAATIRKKYFEWLAEEVLDEPMHPAQKLATESLSAQLRNSILRYVKAYDDEY